MADNNEEWSGREELGAGFLLLFIFFGLPVLCVKALQGPPPPGPPPEVQLSIYRFRVGGEVIEVPAWDCDVEYRPEPVGILRAQSTQEEGRLFVRCYAARAVWRNCLDCVPPRWETRRGEEVFSGLVEYVIRE